jgi:hypothetical protein
MDGYFLPSPSLHYPHGPRKSRLPTGLAPSPFQRFISVRSRNVRLLGDGGLLIRIWFIRFGFFLFPFVSALVSDTWWISKSFCQVVVGSLLWARNWLAIDMLEWRNSIDCIGFGRSCISEIL